MNVDLKGFNENIATFMVDDTVKVGSLVKITGNYTVSECSQGDDFIGVCISLREDYGAIQIAGYVEIPATSTYPLGYDDIIAMSGTTAGKGAGDVKRAVVYSDTEKIGIIL